VHLELDDDAAGGPVITLVGEVDLAAAADVREAGRAAVDGAEPGAHVVLDVREVTFLDSTGVGAMVDVLNQAAGKGVTIVLRSAPERVRKILEITGLLDRFRLEP
jgi:anti-sigma B factor antagonist